MFQTLESQLSSLNQETIRLDSAKTSLSDSLQKKGTVESLRLWKQMEPLSSSVQTYLQAERTKLKKEGGVYDGRPSKMYDQLFDYQVRTEGFLKSKGLKLKEAPLNETREGFYKSLDQKSYQEALLFIENLILIVKRNDVAILESLTKPAN